MRVSAEGPRNIGDSSRKGAPSMTTKKTSSTGFSAEEKAAMKERAAEAKHTKSAEADAAACAQKIAAMAPDDRALAEQVHAIVMAAVPDLAPKTYYGMPAYARDGKVICFFQESGKFKTRYCTLGFQETANLDDGQMWPTSFAVLAIGDAEHKAITELVKRAAS